MLTESKILETESERRYIDSSCPALMDQVFKLIFSKQCTLRASISNNENINIRAKMNELRNKHPEFEFSYFYSSKLARQTDWLTAISGKPSESSKTYQKRHSPTDRDWHNVFLRVRKAQGKKFVFVLDNITYSKRFLKMKRFLMNSIALRQKYLQVGLKYILIRRIEPNQKFYEQ